MSRGSVSKRRATRSSQPAEHDAQSPKSSSREMITCIDLFAGAGGLSTGLEMAGFSVLFANELEAVYSESLRYNHPQTEVSVDDIRDLSPKKIRRSLGLAKGELDLVAGGPPCQGFSINAPIRSTEDRRNHLFRNFLDFVEEFQPRAVLIENVPGLVSFAGGSTALAIRASLGGLKYACTLRILYAPHFGIPQMRWRTVFLATREDYSPEALFPIPSHVANGRANFTQRLGDEHLVYEREYVEHNASRKGVTVGDAISDLPAVDNGGGVDECAYSRTPRSEYQRLLRGANDKLLNHRCAKVSAINLERLKHIPQGGSWRDIPYDLLPLGMKRARRSDHTKRYGRLAPKEIASTILTKCDPHWGAYFHPTADRVITVREAARLQSFPDRCRFFGSVTDQYKQVGNAVPPLLGCAIGNQIAEVLNTSAKGEAIPRGFVGRGSQFALPLNLQG